MISLLHQPTINFSSKVKHIFFSLPRCKYLSHVGEKEAILHFCCCVRFWTVFFRTLIPQSRHVIIIQLFEREREEWRKVQTGFFLIVVSHRALQNTQRVPQISVQMRLLVMNSCFIAYFLPCIRLIAAIHYTLDGLCQTRPLERGTYTTKNS